MQLKSISLWRNLALAIAAVLAITGLILTHAGQAQTTSEVKIDHSAFPVLQGPFASPQEVTKTCLSCHAAIGQEIIHTTHWTWEFVNETTGQTLGKKTLINNFCIGIQSNEPRCTSCHIGYGWKDNTFDFTAQENIDCLVCHDTTGKYKKFPTGAGLPVSEPKEFPAGSGVIWEPPDLLMIAQSVGKTTRASCGTCHFFGGGGDEVKHGDLDSSLINPPFELDVHMSPDGSNFTCTTCHTTVNHEIAGSRYSMESTEWQGCESCHTTTPHELDTLNQHTEKVSCQTCHIPEFARGGIATKMTWDWSKAGELTEEGKPVIRKDEQGHVIYDGQKGEFTLAADVVPDYVWFNGEVAYTLAGDTIDPSQVVSINNFIGGREDPEARIWPVKRFTGVQPYDSGNNTLVIPHLFGKDDTAYWGNYDWSKAITTGMETAGLPFSGEYDFVETKMDWPITHMVAPASQSLNCQDCHTTEGSRLDFVALGYSESEVQRLTNFPPTLEVEQLNLPQFSPESCAGCHADENDLWAQSNHGDKGVGCVSCHQLEGEGVHPLVSFTMDRSASTCGACHLKEFRDWEISPHSQVQVSCTSCHNPHSQKQKTVDDNQTTCETCHSQQVQEVQHSTHLAVKVGCLDCHKNTDLNTGHTFQVNSDSCLKCHGESIHRANALVTSGGLSTPPTETAPGETPQSPTPTPEDAEQTGAGIRIPWWAALFFVVVLGVGGAAIFGRPLGDGKAPKNDEENL